MLILVFIIKIVCIIKFFQFHWKSIILIISIALITYDSVTVSSPSLVHRVSYISIIEKGKSDKHYEYYGNVGLSNANNYQEECD